MTKVLVVHGAGINMRGKSQVEIFGSDTMEDYSIQIEKYADQLGVEVDIYHSNIEGEVINKFYQAHEDGYDAAVINPAASGKPNCKRINQDRIRPIIPVKVAKQKYCIPITFAS